MKYPLSIRTLHWTTAAIIFGMVCVGLTMVSLDDRVPVKFDVLYPWHKSFGILVLILVTARLIVRRRARTSLPRLPATLPVWEARTAKATHVLLYVLMIVVPCMGYCMSSTYTQSDGVFFFGAFLPELLPKNDAHYEVFRLLHRWLAYTLLGVVVLHAAAAAKHRFIDRNPEHDVLSRMI